MSEHEHEHEWIETTDIGDRVRRFVCIGWDGCGAERTEPREERRP